MLWGSCKPLQAQSPIDLSQLTAINDLDLLTNRSRRRAQAFNALHQIHTSSHLAKDNMLAIKPRGRDSGQEELRAVGVRTSVGHGQQTRLSVSQGEVLVCSQQSAQTRHGRGGLLTLELVAIDGNTASAVELGEITSLEHERGDHTVEDGILVGQLLGRGALLASAESSVKILWQ